MLAASEARPPNAVSPASIGHQTPATIPRTPERRHTCDLSMSMERVAAKDGLKRKREASPSGAQDDRRDLVPMPRGRRLGAPACRLSNETGRTTRASATPALQRKCSVDPDDEPIDEGWADSGEEDKWMPDHPCGSLGEYPTVSPLDRRGTRLQALVVDFEGEEVDNGDATTLPIQFDDDDYPLISVAANTSTTYLERDTGKLEFLDDSGRYKDASFNTDVLMVLLLLDKPPAVQNKLQQYAVGALEYFEDADLLANWQILISILDTQHRYTARITPRIFNIVQCDEKATFALMRSVLWNDFGDPPIEPHDEHDTKVLCETVDRILDAHDVAIRDWVRRHFQEQDGKAGPQLTGAVQLPREEGNIDASAIDSNKPPANFAMSTGQVSLVK